MNVPSHADALLRKIAGPSGLLAGRYRLLDVLGQGGMGVVFQALDERLGRDVAIKAIRSDLTTEEFTSRFAQEATALARIHHPNVIQILDVSEPGSPTAYYVMELVQGTPLSRLMREQGRLPWSQACDLLTQIASALAAVHAAGVVHRDLKPSNVLCVKTGRESWHAELIDFGIAIAPGLPRLTRPGEMLGTLPYMSPEQFAGVDIDRRTDVYGWGVLALELLGGVKPAELFGDTALAGAPLRERAPRVLEQARVRPDLARIVERCLATRPDDRWPDMESVHGELADLDRERGLTLVYHRERAQPKTGTMLPDDAIAPVRVEEPATIVAEPIAPPADPPRRGSILPLTGVVLAAIAAAGWLAYRSSAAESPARVEVAMQSWPTIAITNEPAPPAPVEAPPPPPIEPARVVVAEPSPPPIDPPKAAPPRRKSTPGRSSEVSKPAPPGPSASPPPPPKSDGATTKPFVRDPFAE